MKVVVGCPVRKRNWILPEWRSHVEAGIPDGVEVSYAFVVDEDDLETCELLGSWSNTALVPVKEPFREDERSWGPERYEHMSYLRNTLLSYVRMVGPDFFLSLDSDILIHPDALANLIETAIDNNADAVGGLTYLDPVDHRVTNIANWSNRSMTRFNRVLEPGVHPVDVIMAIKLMAPNGYNTDYPVHNNGEDLGWSAAMTGRSIFCDGRVASKHVMRPKYLELVDLRVGY